MRICILFAIFGVLLSASIAWAEPSSYYSCDIAQEKLVKAQRVLRAEETKLREAQLQEELIRTELWTCQPGGVLSLARIRRCGHAHDILPGTMKQTIEATYRVEELQQTVHERQAWQMKVCEATP